MENLACSAVCRRTRSTRRWFRSRVSQHFSVPLPSRISMDELTTRDVHPAGEWVKDLLVGDEQPIVQVFDLVLDLASIRGLTSPASNTRAEALLKLRPRIRFTIA